MTTEIILQLIATFILVMIVKKVAYPSYLEYLEKRTKFVNEGIEEVSKNKELSASELEALKSERKEFTSKASQLEKQIKTDANAEKAVIINEGKEQAKQIIIKAQNEVDSQIDEVEKELMSKAYDLVAETAKLYLSKELTEEDDMKLIEEALTKVKNA